MGRKVIKHDWKSDPLEKQSIQLGLKHDPEASNCTNFHHCFIQPRRSFLECFQTLCQAMPEYDRAHLNRNIVQISHSAGAISGDLAAMWPSKPQAGGKGQCTHCWQPTSLDDSSHFERVAQKRGRTLKPDCLLALKGHGMEMPCARSPDCTSLTYAGTLLTLIENRGKMSTCGYTRWQ